MTLIGSDPYTHPHTGDIYIHVQLKTNEIVDKFRRIHKLTEIVLYIGCRVYNLHMHCC